MSTLPDRAAFPVASTAGLLDGPASAKLRGNAAKTCVGRSQQPGEPSVASDAHSGVLGH